MEIIDEQHQEQSIDYSKFIDTTTITVDDHDGKPIDTDNNNTQNTQHPMDIIEMSEMQSISTFHDDQMETHIAQSPISNTQESQELLDVDIKCNEHNNDINIDCLSPDYDEKLHYE
eukprot:499745_1